LEEGLGHDAVLTAILAWVGKRPGCYFAPWYNVCVFYLVKRVYVDGLEVGNDECLTSEESAVNEMKCFGVRGV